MNLTEASTLSQRSSDEDLTRFLSMANNLGSTGSASSMPWNAADDGGLHRSALSVFDAPPSLGLSWTDEESGKYMQSNPTSAVNGHDFELALPNVSYTTDSRTDPANHGLSNQYRIASGHGSLLDGGSSDLQWCNFANGYDTTGHDTLMPQLDLVSGHSEFFNRAGFERGSTSVGPVNSLLLSADNSLLSSSLDTSNTMNTGAGQHEGSLLLPNLTYPDSPISSSSSHRHSDSRSSHHPYLPLPQYSLRYHPTTQSFSAEPSYSSGEELFVPPSVLSSLGGDDNAGAFQVKHDGGALGRADFLDTAAAISEHPTHRSSSRSSNSAASQGSVIEGARKRGTRSKTRLDLSAIADSDDLDEGDDEDAYQPSRSTSPYLSSGNDSGSQYSSEWSSRVRKRIKGKANYKVKGLGKISAAEALAQVSSNNSNSSRNGSTEDSSQSHGGFDGRSRKNRNIPLPIPIPHLTKKSRGRKVPHVDTTSSRHANNVVHSEDAASGSVRGLNSARRGRGGSSRSAGGRSFVCTVPGCGKCFIRGEHLKRHIRSIHTNEKPHPCPYAGCDKSFSRRDNLGQHVRLHLLNTST